MVGPIAQLVALCCHFNGRSRGFADGSFFPENSTCQYCEYIHFVRRQASSAAKPESWEIVATTPDEWLRQEAKPGRSAVVIRRAVNHPMISDRKSAGFVGGGGRWLLATSTDEGMNFWEGWWRVGNREAADQRIWQVHY